MDPSHVVFTTTSNASWITDSWHVKSDKATTYEIFNPSKMTYAPLKTMEKYGWWHPKLSLATNEYLKIESPIWHMNRQSGHIYFFTQEKESNVETMHNLKVETLRSWVAPIGATTLDHWTKIFYQVGPSLDSLASTHRADKQAHWEERWRLTWVWCNQTCDPQTTCQREDGRRLWNICMLPPKFANKMMWWL